MYGSGGESGEHGLIQPIKSEAGVMIAWKIQ